MKLDLKEVTVEQWFTDETMLMSKFVEFVMTNQQLPESIPETMIKGDWHEQYEAWVSNQIEDKYNG